MVRIDYEARTALGGLCGDRARGMAGCVVTEDSPSGVQTRQPLRRVSSARPPHPRTRFTMLARPSLHGLGRLRSPLSLPVRHGVCMTILGHGRRLCRPGTTRTSSLRSGSVTGIATTVETGPGTQHLSGRHGVGCTPTCQARRCAAHQRPGGRRRRRGRPGWGDSEPDLDHQEPACGGRRCRPP